MRIMKEDLQKSSDDMVTIARPKKDMLKQ